MLEHSSQYLSYDVESVCIELMLRLEAGTEGVL